MVDLTLRPQKLGSSFTMVSDETVLGDEMFWVQRVNLLVNCHKFLEHPDLLLAPYKIRSAVAVASLKQFVQVIEGSEPHITRSNASDLSVLCEEFGFVELAERMSEFDPRLRVVPEAKVGLPDDIRQLFEELEGNVHVLKKRRDELLLKMAGVLVGG
jgi:hypothetical protein